ncbi:uncharacterized protein EV420DRAFT_1600825 [Desarmillaria tabescens]|uniref:Uncharacterized protein n=1 Tax=Armillaria tabescens TaxID=1929756 RepID=A0AA39MGV9_ARMTA|nr:uncharacterized protein EV420DRAFT_1600825 [Desarmillaria tabescens]KAK0433383.1 hypothetical protein EV420DRAFT_1600825 [Desarmillaria tabescens]
MMFLSVSIRHPHILSLKAMSSRNACTPFIVYGINEHQSPELFTATAILSGIDSTFVAGATLSALDYLSCSDIRLDSADIENIYIFMDGPNKAVLSINTYYRLSNSTPSDLLPSQMALDALNYLCLKIFNGANPIIIQITLSVMAACPKPSDDTVTESSLEVSSKDDDLSSTTGASSSVNDAKLSQPRREIIWPQFKNALKSRSITSFHWNVENAYGGANQSHRCQGYRREEVTLTPVVADCRVITDTTPILHEQCPICGEKVGEGPFRCVCGNGTLAVGSLNGCFNDPDATWCLAWGHSRCRTSKDFLCKDCAPSMNFQGSGMSRPRRFCGRQWCPQAPWSIGKYCWYQFVQNGRPVIARYQCLVLHDSTNKIPSPQLWRQV